MAAAHVLRRMPGPRPDLARLLHESTSEFQRRRQHIEALERARRESDLEIGREHRVRLVLFAAVALALFPWVDTLWSRMLGPQVGALTLFLAPLVGWGIAGLALLIAGGAQTEISYRVAGIAALAAAVNTVTRYLVFQDMVTTDRLIVLDQLPLLVALAVFALFVDLRLTRSLAVAGIFFGMALHAPASQLPALSSLAHLSAIGLMAWTWSRPTTAQE